MKQARKHTDSSVRHGLRFLQKRGPQSTNHCLLACELLDRAIAMRDETAAAQAIDIILVQAIDSERSLEDALGHGKKYFSDRHRRKFVRLLKKYGRSMSGLKIASCIGIAKTLQVKDYPRLFVRYVFPRRKPGKHLTPETVNLIQFLVQKAGSDFLSPRMLSELVHDIVERPGSTGYDPRIPIVFRHSNRLTIADRNRFAAALVRHQFLFYDERMSLDMQLRLLKALVKTGDEVLDHFVSAQGSKRLRLEAAKAVLFRKDLNPRVLRGIYALCDGLLPADLLRRGAEFHLKERIRECRKNGSADADKSVHHIGLAFVLRQSSGLAQKKLNALCEAGCFRDLVLLLREYPRPRPDLAKAVAYALREESEPMAARYVRDLPLAERRAFIESSPSLTALHEAVRCGLRVDKPLLIRLFEQELVREKPAIFALTWAARRLQEKKYLEEALRCADLEDRLGRLCALNLAIALDRRKLVDSILAKFMRTERSRHKLDLSLQNALSNESFAG